MGVSARDRGGDAQWILDRCRALGFALAGIAPASRSRRPDALRAWLAAGKHGEMAYLAAHEERLIDPDLVLDGVKSIICVADRYHDGAPDAAGPARRGRIARYARGADYHRVIKRRLHALCDDLRGKHPSAQFRACVDTAPVLEREHAERAGLGAVGKHTLLIERGVGSFLLLGEVLTTLELTPSPPSLPDPCGDCTRCIDACPTGAITPWSVDGTRCISYLTIEHRTAIDRRYHAAMGDWIFGCDVCQEVCPHNQATERSRGSGIAPAYVPRRDGFDLLEVLSWTEADRRAAFVTSALKRARLAMMKRNALIAAGNAMRVEPQAALLARIGDIAADAGEDDLVRETAREVLRGSASGTAQPIVDAPSGASRDAPPSP